MIECEIYEESDINRDPVKIGSKPGSQFGFNTIPREGDVLWLQFKDGTGKTVQKACIVTFSAQWCSDSVDNNHGYLEVRLSDDLSKEG